MENKKEATSSPSSSSFTTQLFGPKDSSSSLFDSIFPPPSKVHKGDYISYEQPKKNYGSTPKRDCLDNEEISQKSKMIDFSPYYEQQVSQPCTLSSSLHYGGQDIYINPHSTKNTPGQYSTQKYSNKDGEDDGLASRGNWWQGSLYY